MSDPTTRVKVTVKMETKEALEKVAARLGMSLSELLLSAAVEKYLGAGRDPIEERLVQVMERLVEELQDRPVSAEPEIKKPRKKRWGDRLGVTGSATHEPVLNTPNPSVLTAVEDAIKTGVPCHVDYLIEHWGGDHTLKARLCQLGGRGGHLFQGSLVHAQKVEAKTKELDPRGLAWFPLSPDRDYWIHLSGAAEYVRRIISS